MILATPGLVSYWRLDELDGRADDRAPGPKNLGEYDLGVTRAQPGALVDRNPNDLAARFDGSAGQIQLGPELQLGSSFTIEAWIKPEGPLTAGQTIFGAAAIDGDRARGFNLFLVEDPARGRGLLVTVGTGEPGLDTAETFVALPAALPDEPWRHVVARRQRRAPGPDSAHLGLHAHGTRGGQHRRRHLQPQRDRALRIAAITPGPPSFFFSGRIDEVALYTWPSPRGASRPTTPRRDP